MSSLGWYWHRLHAMGGSEIAGRLRRKALSFVDQRKAPRWGDLPLEANGSFPELPEKSAAPTELRKALAQDVNAILKGEWLAFGKLPITVDRPPRWHCDYLAGQDLLTTRSAFRLNHRQLPGGADIKMIWELSRWFQLVRLAQAAWLLGHKEAASNCLDLLNDWTSNNPPFLGWNWTSALESGIRLIQFTWIDSLLSPMLSKIGWAAGLDRLRQEILPPHAWFTWRHKSFGSSANNHLLGELSGLIVATSRWPALEKWCAPLAKLHQLWEREVLAQFADDGGNLEQALNYHLFSFEFAWQARLALRASGLRVSKEVDERMSRAAKFFVDVQVESEPWDYGDSDGAYVTPFFIDQTTALGEWYRWLQSPSKSPALEFWLGAPDLGQSSSPSSVSLSDWSIYPQTGIAVQRNGDWTLRWDLSPLGYLSTAAHGHADALHLSIWFKERAIVIDPGTGAYYQDRSVRNYLSSWQAHNGPRLEESIEPRRVGPFLWADHHERPSWLAAGDDSLRATLRLKLALVGRTITRLQSGKGWEIADSVEAGVGPISVRWQFPPDTVIHKLPEHTFRVALGPVSIWVQVNKGATAELIDFEQQKDGTTLSGVCSSSFRQMRRGACLDVKSSSHKPCALQTTFLASPPS